MNDTMLLLANLIMWSVGVILVNNKIHLFPCISYWHVALIHILHFSTKLRHVRLQLVMLQIKKKKKELRWSKHK